MVSAFSNAMAGRKVTMRSHAPVAARRSVVVRAAAQADGRKRIVITGMGVVSCHGNDYNTFYDKLLEGESGIKIIQGFDISEFPTKFAGEITDFDSEGLIDRKSERRYDPCLKYTMVASKKALADAGLSKENDEEAFEKLDKTKVGVLVGSGMGGLQMFEDGVTKLVTKGHKKMSPFFIPYSITNMGGALVAIDQGFMGPNYSISTACATANYAYHAAANHIRNGDADVMVAGGSEAPVCAVGIGGFVACRALSGNNDNFQGASRPWDKGRDGFVMGEGAGVLVMESLEHAQERGANIICEYLGGGITCDAHHMTDPRSDGLGVSTCIENAIRDARIDRDQINYINAHATSTLVGDVAEVKAVRSVFSDWSHIKMNATKSLIGHCLGAAAGVEAIATIMAIKTGELHPTINHDDPIDEIEGIDVVANVKQSHTVTAAVSNSFGFGGHNSSCIFAPFKE